MKESTEMPEDTNVTGDVKDVASSPVEVDNKPLVITDPDEWLEENPDSDTEIVALPSGKVVKLKKVIDLRSMIRAGRVPNMMVDMVLGHVEQDKPKTPKTKDQKQQDAVELFEFMDRIVVDSVVEPRVVIPPTVKKKIDGQVMVIDDPEWIRPKGTWSIRQFDMSDIAFVNAFVGSGASEFEQFPA